jgi:hypothetical protein
VEPFDLLYLVCGSVCAVVLAYKARHLRGRWRSPTIRAICGTLCIAVFIMWLAAPASQSAVNRLAGVPNLAIPLIYGAICLLAASFLAMALLWRYPARVARSRIRWIVVAYALVLATIAGLFAMSSVPEERHYDFDVHYATQPVTAAWVVIALASIIVGSGTLAYWCFTWARDEPYADLPWLRRGMRLYGATSLALALSMVVRGAVIGAHVFGATILDPLITLVPMVMAPMTTLLVTAALVVPAWGPRLPAVAGWLRRWRAVLVLRPLHRELRSVGPGAVLVARAKRFDPHHRVRRMVIELSDWRWTLAPLFDPAVEEAAARAGRAAGLAGAELAAAVEAARLTSAARAWRAGARSGPSGDDQGGPDGPDDPFDGPRDGADFDAELDWWVEVARAHRRPLDGRPQLAMGPRGS